MLLAIMRSSSFTTSTSIIQQFPTFAITSIINIFFFIISFCFFLTNLIWSELRAQIYINIYNSNEQYPGSSSHDEQFYQYGILLIWQLKLFWWIKGRFWWFKRIWKFLGISNAFMGSPPRDAILPRTCPLTPGHISTFVAGDLLITCPTVLNFRTDLHASRSATRGFDQYLYIFCYWVCRGGVFERLLRQTLPWWLKFLTGLIIIIHWLIWMIVRPSSTPRALLALMPSMSCWRRTW